MPKRKNKSSPAPSLGKQLATLIHHPQETLIFCVASVLDVVMTLWLLNRRDISFTESNPFAGYFLDRWGINGLAYFKAAMTVFVCVITQLVARQNSRLARQVLGLSTVIIVAVVIYSVWLHFNHGQFVETIEAIIPSHRRIDSV